MYLDFDDVITFFEHDEPTRAIVIYVEGLENPQGLMKVAKHVSKHKPILALKGGKGKHLKKLLFHTLAPWLENMSFIKRLSNRLD